MSYFSNLCSESNQSECNFKLPWGMGVCTLSFDLPLLFRCVHANVL